MKEFNLSEKIVDGKLKVEDVKEFIKFQSDKDCQAFFKHYWQRYLKQDKVKDHKELRRQCRLFFVSGWHTKLGRINRSAGDKLRYEE